MILSGTGGSLISHASRGRFLKISAVCVGLTGLISIVRGVSVRAARRRRRKSFAAFFAVQMAADAVIDLLRISPKSVSVESVRAGSSITGAAEASLFMQRSTSIWAVIALVLLSAQRARISHSHRRGPGGKGGEVQVAEIVARLAAASEAALERPPANLTLSTQGLPGL